MKTYRRSLTLRTALLAIGALAGGLGLAPTVSAAGARPVTTAATSCKTSGLVVWLDTRGGAAAGSVYYSLKFTNQSGHTCALIGYPGVSAVDLRGHRLGSAASRDPSRAHTVSLANGATASAQLRITQALNFPRSTCRPVAAAGLRVFPPNQTASKVVPIPFRACSKAGPVYLGVKAVSGAGH
jgi:hypothetical protein